MDKIQRLHKDVLFLTSVKPARNYLNIEVLNKVASYLNSEFSKLNCETSYQEFKAGGQTYKNVRAIFGPETGERIVVGAHYDVAGDQPGADDNASAVAGLLELARMIDSHPEDLTYKVELVAYCLEEPPFFGTDEMGSAVHAAYLAEKNLPVKAMICLEMIGYFSDEPGSQGYPNEEIRKKYPDAGNFIVVVGKEGQEGITNKVKELMKEHAAIDVQSINLPLAYGLAGLSDHRSYWKYGIDAVMINDTSFLRNPNYHTLNDTIETLNFEKMAEVVKGVYAAVKGLLLG